METHEQLNTCRKCSHQRRDEHAQIHCSFANKTPDSEGNCATFLADPYLINEGVFDEFETDKFLESAGNGKRFLNHIIDYTVYQILLIVVFIFLIIIERQEILNDQFVILTISFTLLAVYYTFMEYFTGGRTVGKYLTRTKVITNDGLEPSLKNCFIRTLCRFIPFEQFSFFGTTDGAWHDSIPNTRVVIIPKK